MDGWATEIAPMTLRVSRDALSVRKYFGQDGALLMSWLFDHYSRLWGRLKREPDGGRRSAVNLSQLEDRVLFSASPVDPALLDGNVAATTDFVDSSVSYENFLGDNPTDGSQPYLADAADQQSGEGHGLESKLLTIDETEPFSPAPSRSHELVFVDPSAADYEQLLNDLLANADESRDFDVVLLDASRDGIEQISEVLAGYDNLDAVHIVSPGTDHALKLGDTWLQLDNLEGYAGDIAGWGNALDADAASVVPRLRSGRDGPGAGVSRGGWRTHGRGRRRRHRQHRLGDSERRIELRRRSGTSW